MNKTICAVATLVALSIFSFGTHAATICNTILSTSEFEEYVEGLADMETTPEKVRAVEEVLVSAIAELRVANEHGSAILAQGVERFAGAQRYVQMALSAYNKGWTNLFARSVKALREELEYFLDVPLDEESISQDLVRLSLRREFEVGLGMATFILRGQDSVERRFLLDLPTDRSRTLSFGLAELEATRLFLQFGNTMSGDSVLDLDGKAATTMSALRYYLSKLNFDRAFAASPTPGERAWADAHGQSLLNADYRTNEGMMEIKRRADRVGGYRVVVAVEPDHAAITRTRLRAIAGLVQTHGFFIYVENYDQPEPSSVDAVRAAGFEIVRWGVDRRVPPILRKAFGDEPDVAGIGLLRIYVLRKGPEDPSRTPMRNQADWDQIRARRPPRAATAPPPDRQ